MGESPRSRGVQVQGQGDPVVGAGLKWNPDRWNRDEDGSGRYLLVMLMGSCLVIKYVEATRQQTKCFISTSNSCKSELYDGQFVTTLNFG